MSGGHFGRTGPKNLHYLYLCVSLQVGYGADQFGPLDQRSIGLTGDSAAGSNDEHLRFLGIEGQVKYQQEQDIPDAVELLHNNINF